MTVYAGIDAGSRAIKIVLIDASKNIVASGSRDQGIKQNALTEELLQFLLEEHHLGIKDVEYTVATGYGRNMVALANETVTEITCHAKGVHHLVPGVATVVEIGGQDSKWLCLDGNGLVRDFNMNDRCAAGTGRFLEVVANRLDVKLEQLGEMIEQSEKPATISSMCVVFAETEIIGLLASGVAPENIVAGVQNSITTRVAAMAGRKVIDPVVFTGGVALIPGMANSLETALKR